MSISEYVRREMEQGFAPPAIGIASNGRGVGKSYFAARLGTALAANGYTVHYLSMADQLRKAAFVLAVRLLRPIPYEALYEDKDKPLAEVGAPESWHPLTGRDLLIALGETMVDTMGEGFWADAWRRKARTLPGAYDGKTVIICDDIRRPAEALTIQSVGGVLVYLEGREATTGKLEGLIDPRRCHYHFHYAKNAEVVRAALDEIMKAFPPL